jgi:hypothetical protein
MDQILMPEIDLDPRADEDALVHEWRVEQLRELGVPRRLAERFAAPRRLARPRRACPARLPGRARARDRPLILGAAKVSRRIVRTNDAASGTAGARLPGRRRIAGRTSPSSRYERRC